MKKKLKKKFVYKSLILALNQIIEKFYYPTSVVNALNSIVIRV